MTVPPCDPCYETEPIPDTINDILLYLQTETQHNCHQRGFAQQLIEIDAEAYSQILSGAWGILQKSGRKQ